MKEFLERLMQNKALVPVFVKKFLEDTNYEKLVLAIQKNDKEAAESACHTLKGVCGNLSLKTLFGMFQEQLTYFRAGEYEKAVEMMGAISLEYYNAVTHMQAWIEQQ